MKKLIVGLVVLITSQLYAQTNFEPITWQVSYEKTSERTFRFECRALIHPDYSLMSQIQPQDSMGTVFYRLFPKEARGIGYVEESGVRIEESGRVFYKDSAILRFVVRTSADSVRISFEIEHRLLYQNTVIQPKARRFSRTLINTNQENETSNSGFDGHPEPDISVTGSKREELFLTHRLLHTGFGGRKSGG